MTQLVIFVGSRMAGRVKHLDRLVQSSPETYVPLKTVTTRTEEKPGDETWFVRMTPHEVCAYGTDESLTFFQEGEARYFILVRHYEEVRWTSRIPVVGMTPQGLERLMSRNLDQLNLSFSAVVLKPADPDEFREALMRDRGLDPDLAREETDRAMRLSTVPPPSSKRTSIYPVPVHGNVADAALVDQLMHRIAAPWGAVP